MGGGGAHVGETWKATRKPYFCWVAKLVVYDSAYIYIYNHIHNHIPIDTNNYINTVTYLHIHRLYIKYIRIHVHTRALVHVHSVLTWHQATSPAAPCLLVTRQSHPSEKLLRCQGGTPKGERIGCTRELVSSFQP